jgi:carbon monoxide dehydrogenase subunit G
MHLHNEFTVPAPIDRAWDTLLDVERVAPCLPGAALDGAEGDAHTGTMTIKLGPISTRYKGTVRIEEADEHARRSVLRAQARDARGQGTAAATITCTMAEVAEGTRIRVETDLRVTGPASQFGQGIMQEVSAKLMGLFADCLAEEISAPDATPAGDTPAPAAPAPPPRAAEPLDLGAAGGEALARRAVPAAVVVLAALLGLRMLRRLRR